MEKLPDFKNEEEKDKFFEATKITEDSLGQNPQGKYRPGDIKQFNKEATKNGEYKPHIDSVIKKTKDELNNIYKEMEQNSKATFSPSKEHTNPEEALKEKLEKFDENSEE